MQIRESENNKTYGADYLFEDNGCKVDRFYDRGNYVYFTNCQGEEIVKTDSTEMKNSIRRRANEFSYKLCFLFLERVSDYKTIKMNRIRYFIRKLNTVLTFYFFAPEIIWTGFDAKK